MPDETDLKPETFVEWLARMIEASGRDMKGLDALALEHLRTTNETLYGAIPPGTLRATENTVRHILRRLSRTQEDEETRPVELAEARVREVEDENAKLRALLDERERELELLRGSPRPPSGSAADEGSGSRT
jgi:hypothetical protein